MLRLQIKRSLSMMLQKKLVIGISAFIFSSITVGANAIEPAQSQKSSSSVSTTQAAQGSQEEEPTESVLTPGARLVAGESQNEFYILDKDEPLPVKASDKKPDAAPQNNMTNRLDAGSTGNTPIAVTASSKQIAHAIQDDTDFAELTAEEFESVTTIEGAKDKVSMKTTMHKLIGKKAAARVKFVMKHEKRKIALRHKNTRSKVTLRHSASQLARKGSVDQIRVLPHWTVHHHKVAVVKTKTHATTASRRVKRSKVVSKKKTSSKVYVALNKRSTNLFRDAVKAPEIY
jgi:hypothetical protein